MSAQGHTGAPDPTTLGRHLPLSMWAIRAGQARPALDAAGGWLGGGWLSSCRRRGGREIGLLGPILDLLAAGSRPQRIQRAIRAGACLDLLTPGACRSMRIVDALAALGVDAARMLTRFFATLMPLMVLHACADSG